MEHDRVVRIDFTLPIDALVVCETKLEERPTYLRFRKFGKKKPVLETIVKILFGWNTSLC